MLNIFVKLVLGPWYGMVRYYAGYIPYVPTHMIDDEALYPRSFFASFDGLTLEQQAAAVSLCYIEPLWDGKPTSRWSDEYAYLATFDRTDEAAEIDRLVREQVAAIPFPHRRFTEFQYLPSSLQSDVVGSMGYSPATWNEPGEADVEYYSLEDICFYFENAPQNWTCSTLQTIVKLGFDRDNDDQWDCWMNHYDDYRWSDLQESNVAQYYETMGYTEEVRITQANHCCHE